MSFRHDEPGPPESFWHQRVATARPGALQLVPTARITVLAAHPDDETLGAGGLITAAAEHGCQVTVIVATDGEGSHPRSTTWTPEALSIERRRELTTAVTRLAPSAAIEFLGLPDGRLSEFVPAVTTALVRAEPDMIAAPWRRDAHPDHDAAGHAAAQAAGTSGAALLEYPVWFWHWGDQQPDALPWSQLVRLDLTTAQREAKAAAMAEHRTQVAALSAAAGDEVLLDEHVLHHFRRPFELFVRTPGRHA